MGQTNKEDRISTLGQRFSSRSQKKKAAAEDASSTPAKENKKNRRRRSFYLDEEIFERVDLAYSKVNYEIIPQKIDKADFVEALFDYALNHLEEVKELIKK